MTSEATYFKIDGRWSRFEQLFFRPRRKEPPPPWFSVVVFVVPLHQNIYISEVNAFILEDFLLLWPFFHFVSIFILFSFSSLFKYFYYFFFSEAFFTIEIFFITVKFFTILTIMRPICLRYFSLLLRLWRNYFEIKTICNEMAVIISFSLADQF